MTGSRERPKSLLALLPMQDLFFCQISRGPGGGDDIGEV